MALSKLLKRGVLATALTAITLTVAALPSWAAVGTTQSGDLNSQVYRQLMNQPFFTVFDNLQFQINGSEVTLLGQTANPTLKHDAVDAVRQIPGVTQVNDNIELLPESPFDNGIRRAEYRKIYSAPSLQKYAEGTYPSIHIIVDNGHVTLVGTVNNQQDKQIAETRALQVPTVFSVKNELQVG